MITEGLCEFEVPREALNSMFRLCAAHPKGCMSISIVTILFLSYPAISKLGLPVSSPIDVCWTSGDQAPEEQLNS